MKEETENDAIFKKKSQRGNQHMTRMSLWITLWKWGISSKNQKFNSKNPNGF